MRAMKGVAPVNSGQTRRFRGSRLFAVSSPLEPGHSYGRPVGFASTEHLNPEAVVAYVDNELSRQAASRADAHLVLCPSCSREVAAQARARSMLQTCQNEVSMPDSLRAQLSQIPTQEIDLRATRRSNRWGR